MTNYFQRAAPALLAAVLAGAVACSGSADDRKQRFLASGDRYFAQAKYREAALEFRNAVQIDPTFGEARLKLARSLERLGDGPGAFQEYIRAADLRPDDLDGQLTAGSYLLAARRFDDARARAEAVINRDANNVQAHVLLGNALAGLRDFDQAIKEIEQAIELDPTRGATFANLGLVETQRGQQDKAEEAFKRSVALKPEWVPGHLALANHYWATNRIAQAEAELSIALKIEPRNAIANRAMALLYMASKRDKAAEPYARALAETGGLPFALADFYLLQNRPDDAIAQLERLRKDERIGAEAGRRLARAYAMKGDREAARRVLRELLASNSMDPESLLIDGQLLAAEGKASEALARLNAAAKADPRSAAVQFELGRAHASRADYDQARQAFANVLELNPHAAAAQVELARLDLAAGKVDSSVQHARDAVRNEPANVDAQLSLIRGLIAARQIAEADALLQPLLAAHPNIAVLHVQRGLIAASRRQMAGARQSFERALSLDRNTYEALGALASLDQAAGSHTAARARIDARLAADPEQPELLLISARTAAAAKDLSRAERDLTRAVEADPRFLPAYKMLVQVYVAGGKLAEARRQIDALVEREPRPVAALTIRGLVAQAQNDAAAAQESFERALEFDPATPIAANNLAWIYADRGQNLASALELAKVAQRGLPKTPEVLDTLGWVHYKRGTADEAILAFTEAAKVAPANPVYKYHLGLAYIQAGNVNEARAALEQALAAGSGFSGTADAARALASLRAQNPDPQSPTGIR